MGEMGHFSLILVRYSAIRLPYPSYTFPLLAPIVHLKGIIHSQLGNFRFPVREQNIPRQGKNKDRRVHNRVGSVVHSLYMTYTIVVNTKIT